MIRGCFVRGRPYVACRVELPRLGVAATIPLLVDTGADHTCIHPKDGPALSIPYEQLDRPTGVIGVAGRSARYVEDAILNFRSSTHSTIHLYRLPVRVGKPEDVDQRPPSLPWDRTSSGTGKPYTRQSPDASSSWSPMQTPPNGSTCPKTQRCGKQRTSTGSWRHASP